MKRDFYHIEIAEGYFSKIIPNWNLLTGIEQENMYTREIELISDALKNQKNIASGMDEIKITPLVITQFSLRVKPSNGVVKISKI